jgi:hypothetical protein
MQRPRQGLQGGNTNARRAVRCPREPADLERQIFSTLDDELRSHIIKLPNIGGITSPTELDPVHMAPDADFEAAWDLSPS